ncbi:MAG: hypothetical protein JW936_05800 [Sedimentisphaerales bacterium]|nr:hypothetical protein [Sedimentisphaerales bacterium]
MRAMFRNLEKRIANPLDDGRVEGDVSLADKAHFDEIEGKEKQFNIVAFSITDPSVKGLWQNRQ